MEINTLFYHNCPLNLLSSLILIPLEFYSITSIPTHLSCGQESLFWKEKCMPDTFFHTTYYHCSSNKDIYYLELKGNTQL